jgi:hypothetical protein
VFYRRFLASIEAESEMLEEKDGAFLELTSGDGGLGPGVGWTEKECGPGQLEKGNHIRSGSVWLAIRENRWMDRCHLILNLGFPLL